MNERGVMYLGCVRCSRNEAPRLVILAGYIYYIANVICYNALMGERHIIQHHEVFRADNMTFILTSDKILVQTSRQTCMIVYANGNYKSRWNKLRDKIRRGEVKNMLDLHQYNGARVGGISQIQGLVLVSTKLDRHIND